MALKRGIVWNDQGRTIDTEYWKDLFTDELRQRGASGTEVGEALAVVESHCAETRTEPGTSFGDPVDYARQLRPRRDPRYFLITWGSMWCGMIAVEVASSLPWLWGGNPVAIGWGSLARLWLMIPLFVGMQPVWRLQRRRPEWGFAAMMAFFMVLGYLNSALRDWTTVALTAPATLLWALAALAGVIGTVLATLAVRDRVIDPRTGQTPNFVPAPAWWLLAAMPLWAPMAIVGLRALSRH